MTITPTDAADQLDVTIHTIHTLTDQMADDPDLVTGDGHITPAGMEILTSQIRTGGDRDLLVDLDEAAAAVAETQEAADEARERRDAAIRAALAAGHPKGIVAGRAGISRVRMHRITSLE